MNDFKGRVQTWSEVKDRILGEPGTEKRRAFDREYARFSRRMSRGRLLTDWMNRVPGIGKLAASFWFLVLTEDDHNPLGGLEFSFLNDGMRPSLWHTWYQMTHGPMDALTGIYPGGAPRTEAEALKIAWREDEAGA